jgi:hypothetical protein
MGLLLGLRRKWLGVLKSWIERREVTNSEVNNGNSQEGKWIIEFKRGIAGGV